MRDVNLLKVVEVAEVEAGLAEDLGESRPVLIEGRMDDLGKGQLVGLKKKKSAC